ncbi:MAG TPA: ABC transporter ATP-binding protein [Anaerolineae bacterium]|nr:ABC transporter ATP-binding protein [Anaerolineae bacterium]
MEAKIKVEHLTKKYQSQKGNAAIDDINLSIHQGELFGLVGPDGAGKTTTLRIISTVLEQSNGVAWVAGFDTKKEAEKARPHIGYMPQNFSLYPDLSVLENLNFFANLNQVPKTRKQVRTQEMLSFTRLERFKSRRAGKLSGGMKKKLALACALIHDPEVLILDEPSTGVDPVSRRELWVILSEVAKQGVTILVSTPYMDEAERCNRVGMLYEGHILTIGTPKELRENIPYEIIEVKAKPRKAMRRIVGETNEILDWRPVGDQLRLTILDTDSTVKRVMKSLTQSFRRESLDVRVLRQVKPSMEDVFVHLIGSQVSPQ